MFKANPDPADNTLLVRINLIYRIDTGSAQREGAIDIVKHAPMVHKLNHWARGLDNSKDFDVDAADYTFRYESDMAFSYLMGHRPAAAQGVEEDNMITIEPRNCVDWQPAGEKDYQLKTWRRRQVQSESHSVREQGWY